MSDTHRIPFSFSVFRQLWTNTKRAGALVWRHNKKIVFVLLCLVVGLAALPFVVSGVRALMINELVRIFGTGHFSAHLVGLLFVYAVGASLPSILNALHHYASKVFWFFLEEQAELTLLKRRAELDIAHREKTQTSNLFTKVSDNGIWRMQTFIERNFYILQNVLEVAIAAVILFSARWWLLLVVFAGMLPELLNEVRYGHSVWSIHDSRAETRRRYWELHSYFGELSAIKELRLFQSTSHFLNLIRELLSSFHADQNRTERARLTRDLITTAISQATLVFALIWFVRDVVNGWLLVGSLTFYIAAISDMRQSLSALFMNLGRHYQDNLFVTDIFSLIDLPDLIQKPAAPIALPERKTPTIVFDNVSFRYTDADPYVLRNVQLTIPAGQKLALVGINGAGKTTLVKLLCRFYDPTEGRILLDGVDLRSVDLETWYRQLGIIFQDYVNYHIAVKDAIAVGRSHAPIDVQKVKDAAQAGEADRFIEEWEHAYEQQLGREFTGGVEPSIGQWQKLALARMFYRDPHIMVLDEPTSSIDAAAEAKIFDRLESVADDRTVILISHRFSTVRKAHKIAVLKDARVEEYGTHEELLAMGGTYANLFRLQAKAYN